MNVMKIWQITLLWEHKNSEGIWHMFLGLDQMQIGTFLPLKTLCS